MYVQGSTVYQSPSAPTNPANAVSKCSSSLASLKNSDIQIIASNIPLYQSGSPQDQITFRQKGIKRSQPPPQPQHYMIEQGGNLSLEEINRLEQTAKNYLFQQSEDLKDGDIVATQSRIEFINKTRKQYYCNDFGETGDNYLTMGEGARLNKGRVERRNKKGLIFGSKLHSEDHEGHCLKNRQHNTIAFKPSTYDLFLPFREGLNKPKYSSKLSQKQIGQQIRETSDASINESQQKVIKSKSNLQQYISGKLLPEIEQNKKLSHLSIQKLIRYHSQSHGLFHRYKIHQLPKEYQPNCKLKLVPAVESHGRSQSVITINQTGDMTEADEAKIIRLPKRSKDSSYSYNTINQAETVQYCPKPLQEAESAQLKRAKHVNAIVKFHSRNSRKERKIERYRGGNQLDAKNQGSPKNSHSHLHFNDEVLTSNWRPVRNIEPSLQLIRLSQQRGKLSKNTIINCVKLLCHAKANQSGHGSFIKSHLRPPNGGRVTLKLQPRNSSSSNL